MRRVYFYFIFFALLCGILQGYEPLKDPHLDCMIKLVATRNLGLKIAKLQVMQALDMGNKVAIDDAKDDYREQLVALTADAAKSYVEYKSLQQRYELLKESIQSQKVVVELREDLWQRGLLDEVLLEDSKQALNSLYAKEGSLQLAMDNAAYHLAGLLNDNVCSVIANLNRSWQFPVLACNFNLRITTDFIKGRADVRKAERDFCNSYGCIPSHIALYQYRDVFSKAILEVETLISSLHDQRKNYEALKLSEEEEKTRFLLTEQLFKKGLKDTIELNQEKLLLLDAKERAIESYAEILKYRVDLHKALGRN